MDDAHASLYEATDSAKTGQFVRALKIIQVTDPGIWYGMLVFVLTTTPITTTLCNMIRGYAGKLSQI
ncbi:hypothetical protein PG993_010009 [Apiospora rasikravindrae]|uniref:Uncharacterized protein n=1 Tax=Apiospora rasikravindrae TaxID=990691 RepID=A0ABR1SMR8_9PEZI